MHERARVKALLRENPVLPAAEFRGMLDAFQIASGHNTGVEGLRALLEWLSEGRPLLLESPTGQGAPQAVSDADALADVIARHDRFIDLRNDPEFQGYFRGSRQGRHQG